MKVAYLVLGSGVQATGFVRKMMRQLSVWRELGVDAEFISLAADEWIPEGIPARCVRLPFPAPTGGKPWSVVAYYLLRVLASPGLRQAIKACSPDVIYLRQTLWWPGMLAALSDFPFVLEINGKDLDEMRLRGGLRAQLHNLSRAWVLDRAAGFVAVTEEIRDTLPVSKPSCTVSNGTYLEPGRFRKPPGNERPQLVFAGAPGQPWNGVDRVPWLASSLPEVDFHVYGDPCPESPNVFYHDYVEQAELSSVYRVADIGIGSLALERKRMDQACPLKVRDYLAHGLPIIASYDDVDLGGAPYFLKLDFNDGSEECAIRIRKFLEHWRGRSLPFDDVERRIGDRSKEQVRVDFLARVAGRTPSRHQ